MSHNQAYVTREQRAKKIVEACEQLVKDHSITAYGRDLARQALEDARALVEDFEGPRRYKPGEKVPASGIYATHTGREAALKRGDRFPPSAYLWELVKEARHAT